MFFTQKKAILGLSIRELQALCSICRLSKNMLNVRLYAALRFYFAERSDLAYALVDLQVKNYEFDKLLSTDIDQQALKVVVRSFKFFVKFREAVARKTLLPESQHTVLLSEGRVFDVDY